MNRSEKEIRSIVARYRHDGFFHFLLNKSQNIRTLVCQKMIPEAAVIATEITNCELYGDFIDGKRFILDIVAADNDKRMYNIEMQAYGIDDGEIVRFQCYGFRLIETGIKKGEEYSEAPLRQMVINASKPIEGLNSYFHHFTMYDKENEVGLPGGVYELYIIQLELLGENEDMEDAFNQLMYLFQNDRKYDKIESDGMIEEAIEMHDEYMKSDEMILAVQRERDRRAQNTYIKKAKREAERKGEKRGHETGLKEGRVEGRKEGTKDAIIMMASNYLLKQFQVDLTPWLNQLTDEQLDIVQKNLYNINSVDELKQKVLNETE